MPMKKIGQNIRKCRHAKHMSIEELAFRAELSKNYMGMVERGERVPSLETMVKIINALDVSADEVFCDVTNQGFKVKATLLSDRIAKAPLKTQKMIYDLIELVLLNTKDKEDN